MKKILLTSLLATLLAPTIIKPAENSTLVGIFGWATIGSLARGYYMTFKADSCDAAHWQLRGTNAPTQVTEIRTKNNIKSGSYKNELLMRSRQYQAKALGSFLFGGACAMTAYYFMQ
ncbi:MAG: hypothetical protein WC707_04540 [Candidatus Babeliaceae bacterium]|jgi:hypothetical protein